MKSPETTIPMANQKKLNGMGRVTRNTQMSCGDQHQDSTISIAGTKPACVRNESRQMIKRRIVYA